MLSPFRARKTSAALVLLSAVALSACSNGDNAGGSGGGGGDGEVDKVGLMLQDISNPFFASMQKSMEDAAKEQGFDLNVQDGRQDLGTQNDQIDTFIQQGMDLILLNAVDSSGIASAVARAQAAGITVVAVDVDAEGADAAVTTDNVEAGRQSCQALVDALGGTGNILVVEGTPTTAPQDRVKGCEEVLAANTGVKVVARQAGKNDRASGLSLTTDMLTANQDVKGIFAINDPEALGADLAVQQAGRTGVTIVGVDGSPEAVTALEDPSSNFAASAAQDPGGMALKALEVGQGIVAGDEPAERVTLLAPSLVTKDNVADYQGW
ncbi:ABC transporter; periplasmic subunit, sugar-binding protein [Modestobacter italicus]|uniref:ABC transporter periplasmic subunit, sugar-binding protein n=1 Tax=Modestobacter italicus (strain DSM 44449 / CECT 9708 / BC 501) TaxID=2732864 RepID=I4EU46_MODI5|nr:ABC transporter substrate-binding protein [Modestobacter marinus]CCH86909.1 ABC transporter; periplasmic subunit, sugar-binding protein [Modestobacter marinus]